MPSFAQDALPERKHNFKAWYTYAANLKIGDKLSINGSANFRRYGWIKEANQFLSGVGANYKLLEKVEIGGGFGFMRSYPERGELGQFTFNEYRSWGQVGLKQNAGRVSLHHRYRLEQRWVEQHQFPDHTYNFLNRVRYRLQLKIPFAKPSVEHNNFFISVYDEIFMQFGKNAPQIFNQNRFSVSGGYQVSKNFDIQLGYLNLSVESKSDHILQLTIKHNMALDSQ